MRYDRPPPGVALAALLSGLILLHRPDGGGVLVATQHITSLIPTAAHSGGKNRLVHGQALCVVRLTDQQLIAVREPCAAVHRLMSGGQ